MMAETSEWGVLNALGIPAVDRRKELKVKIPVGLHLKLSTLKVLRGKNMGDALQEALAQAFDEEAQAGNGVSQAEIQESEARPQMREMKAKIPLSFHLRLHAMKIQSGVTIHAIVERALEKYFATIAAAQLAAKAPNPASSV